MAKDKTPVVETIRPNAVPVDEPQSRPLGFGGSVHGGATPSPPEEPEHPTQPLPEPPFNTEP